LFGFGDLAHRTTTGNHSDALEAVNAFTRKRLFCVCITISRKAEDRDRSAPPAHLPVFAGEERPDGRLALRLKTRWRDGTTRILMERSELIERLVPLIPPPRSSALA